MLIAAALVPSPPLLVPELCGAAVAETASVRDAAVAVASRLGGLTDRWTVLGAGSRDEVVAAEAVGTFRGFGADVVVSMSPGATEPPDPLLALPALIGAWLRRAAAPEARLDGLIVDAATAPRRCAELGAKLRAELDADARPRGVLVVADGATTLTPKAPGSFDHRAPGLQQEVNDALAAGDGDALAALDPVLCAELGVAGRAAWQVLAGLFPTPPAAVLTAYVGAPYGVGYYAGLWRR